jgi:HD-GYP domain-containing protein (c-di-GMP phosphodiesterase class II)
MRRVAVQFDLPRHEGPVICGLLRTVDAHNPGSAGHALRVCQLARRIAKAFDLPSHGVATITEAALLHDIGKIAIDAHILRKPGSLTEAERQTVRLHVPAGVGLVGAIPVLGRAAVLIRASHEWLDGSGYPRGLRGHAIPLGSRIISVADAFDVLTHARAYSRAMVPARAIAELRDSADSQFDPLVVIALEHVLRPAAVQREPQHETASLLHAL